MTDTINFLSKITLLKAFNSLKVLLSYIYSKASKNNQIYGLPVALAIEPTTSCNLRCPECPSGLRSFTRKTGMLSTSLFTQIIDELRSTLTYLTFYFQGEPYLNPDFLDMVAYASKANIYTATSTNAHYLNKENAIKTVKSGLDKLIISIDGTTQNTYEQYRVGGQLEKVIEGTKNIIAAKNELKSKTPYIVFQFLVVKPNQHQIEDVKSLARQLGVNKVNFKTAQIYDYQNGNDLIPTLEQYSRYKKQANGKYNIKNNLDDHCWKMWHSCVITWDGNVVPCCFDKDAQYSMGELKNQNFKNIWQNEHYRSFRKQLIKGRSAVEMCKNCSEGGLIFKN